ncbi:MAG: FkbM family methyltransferase [Siculibacillus sp.]
MSHQRSKSRPASHPAAEPATIDRHDALMRGIAGLDAKLDRLLAGSAPAPRPDAPGPRFVVSPTADGMMMTDTADMMIGEELRTKGHFEEKHIDRALALLAKAGIGIQNSVFLDIGANIGTHSLHALKLGFQHALCIEPDPDNFRLLRINQILNGVDGRCTNINAAASNREEEGVLELSPSNFGDYRVRSDHAGAEVHDESSWKTRPIVTRTLDGIFASLKIEASLIGFTWIDTQGHEGFVFAGGRGLLAASAPIVCEFWPYGMERSGGYPLLRETLAGSGRRIVELRGSIRSGSLRELTLADLDELYAAMLRGEGPGASPHTDLLLI